MYMKRGGVVFLSIWWGWGVSNGWMAFHCLSPRPLKEPFYSCVQRWAHRGFAHHLKIDAVRLHWCHFVESIYAEDGVILPPRVSWHTDVWSDVSTIWSRLFFVLDSNENNVHLKSGSSWGLFYTSHVSDELFLWKIMWCVKTKMQRALVLRWLQPWHYGFVVTNTAADHACRRTNRYKQSLELNRFMILLPQSWTPSALLPLLLLIPVNAEWKTSWQEMVTSRCLFC